MKNYHLTDKEIIEYNFYSITDFLDHILTQPINDKLFSKLESSAESEYHTNFTKTKNFEEAVNLCKYGYFNGFDKFYSDKLLLQPYITTDGIGLSTAHDSVGFFPDVKAYMEGNPLNMYNKIPKPRSRVSIYYCIGMSGSNNENIIYNRGVITLNIIEALEKLGYQVNLYLFDLSKNDYFGDQYLLVKFLLKKENEKLNYQLVYYPMTHPSFSRRLFFRLIEQTPNLKYGYKNHYGHYCSLDEMQEILGVDDKGIIIGWSKDMDVKGKDLIDDTEAMIKTINERNKQKMLKMPGFKR